MIDDYVNHIFREHNQEADHLTNLGVKGQRKITVDKGDNTENWKAARGFWDCSEKTGGRCGCGVVIKGCGQSQVDHNHLNCSSAEDLYGYGI